MFLRASDLREATSRCWYFYQGRTVGCVLEVKDDNGKPIGYVVLDGETQPQDPKGKLQHGVSILITQSEGF